MTSQSKWYASKFFSFQLVLQINVCTNGEGTVRVHAYTVLGKTVVLLHVEIF